MRTYRTAGNFFNIANHIRPLIHLMTYVVLVIVACGSNMHGGLGNVVMHVRHVHECVDACRYVA